MAVISQHEQRINQHGEHGHLHVERFDLLAQIFRRAAHHQSRDEHGKDDEHDDSVEAGADPSENDFAQQHIDQRNHSAERRVGIVHRVDRAATRVGCHHGPQRGVRDAEADLLALHVSGWPANGSPKFASSGFPRASAEYAAVTPTRNKMAIAHHTAQPWRGEPVICPSV